MSKKRRNKVFLGDIYEAMKNISLYTRGMRYRAFLDDKKTQDAVVRNFEVIGRQQKT